MSQTFSLVCPSTQKRIWLGQGWGEMTNLYSGQPETMEALKRFLNDHIDKPVYFVCDDETGYPIFEWESYDEEPRIMNAGRCPQRIGQREGEVKK